tara:strand:- start:343 stop:1680 length:1338 start_codon:yes stop_codon:yes gene_type:complete
MTTPPDLTQLSPDQLRHLAATLMTQVEEKEKALRHSEQVNQKLTYEMALLKRHAFGKRSEQLNVLQISLLEEGVDADIAAIETELEELHLTAATPVARKTPKRTPLPPELPRTEIHHDPENDHCRCGCQLRRIGEEISEKLDYTPGVFHVERHIRGKWVGTCGVRLQPLIDALREVLLNEPVLHADETPVPMLAPGKKKTHRAYLWAYATTPYAGLKAVIYDFSEGRGGQHARDFLGKWRGKLVCDDYSGYKQSFANGVTEIGCMAHARRKFVDLHVAGKSQIAGQAIELIGQLYQVEREVQSLSAEERQRLRETKAKPIADALHRWMLAHREKVPNGSATAKALDYSLKRWAALTRYLDDGALPIDNNRVENLIRPWALGRSNWLFAGSLRSGQRAATIMSLIQCAKLNGHEPYTYLKNVLERLPTQKASQVHELLPHHWQHTA